MPPPGFATVEGAFALGTTRGWHPLPVALMNRQDKSPDRSDDVLRPRAISMSQGTATIGSDRSDQITCSYPSRTILVELS